MAQSHPVERLTLTEAIERLSVVTFIQLIGLCITLGPLTIWHLFVKENWQLFCLLVGGVAGAVTVVRLLLTYAAMGLPGTNEDRSANRIESTIRFIFIINTIALAFGIARTGGASNSVFSQTIPIQLSGILLLEQQKEKLISTSSDSQAYWWYASFSIVAWVAVALAGKKLMSLFGYPSDVQQTSLEKWGWIAAIVLGAAGMILTVIAYKVEGIPFLVKLFKNRSRVSP
jgi:hypothetical protein